MRVEHMPMHKPEACRRYAKTYEQHAEETRDPARKTAMLELAREWRRMAERQEPGTGSNNAQTPTI